MSDDRLPIERQLAAYRVLSDEARAALRNDDSIFRGCEQGRDWIIASIERRVVAAVRRPGNPNGLEAIAAVVAIAHNAIAANDGTMGSDEHIAADAFDEIARLIRDP